LDVPLLERMIMQQPDNKIAWPRVCLTATEAPLLAHRRAQGEIPRIHDLPPPWGKQPMPEIPEQELRQMGYQPAKYPEGFSPLNDMAAA
jgi:hypothetical protein